MAVSSGVPGHDTDPVEQQLGMKFRWHEGKSATGKP